MGVGSSVAGRAACAGVPERAGPARSRRGTHLDRLKYDRGAAGRRAGVVSLSREEVQRIAALARLDLSAAELERLRGELEQILGHVRALEALGSLPDPPPSQPGVPVAALREDVPAPTLRASEALYNAPDADEGCFRVPPVLPVRKDPA